MSDEDRSPLTDAELAEVDDFMKRYPETNRAQLEGAMRRRRQHADQVAEGERAAAELREKNAATLARSDLTPDERREAEIAAGKGQSAEIAVNTARQIKTLQDDPTPAAHGTNGTAGDSQVGDRQRDRLRAEAEAPKVNAVRPKRTGKRKRKPAAEAPKVDAEALTAELGAAQRWGAEAAALLSWIVYAKHHDGAKCRQQRIMTYLDPHSWWEGLPPDERRRLGAKVAEILRDLAQRYGLKPLTAEQQRIAEAMEAQGLNLADFQARLASHRDAPARDANGRVERDPGTGDVLPDVPTRESAAELQAQTLGLITTAPVSGRKAAAIADAFEALPEHLELPAELLHELWSGCPDRGRHPLAPIVADWQEHAPIAVEAETRADRRIMPALRIVGPTPERERGRLFGGLVDDRTRNAAASLSLFPDLEPERPQVPLLEIVDRAGLPIRSRGRGAPLEARLLVRGGLLMIRPQDRRLETVRIAVTVGELLDGLWPPGPDGRRHVTQHWPRLLDALYRARDWTVPDADGGRWFPMALRRLPPNGTAGTPALDDLVVIDLAPVPGAVTGATVDLPWLDRMGVESGPKWRAYIAARSLMWLPGKTRRPVPGTNGRQYGWSADPADYPVVPAVDLRRLAFGDRDDAAYRRTRAAILAPWEALPDVKIEPATDPRTGVRGYRLLPTDRDE